jgi:hypothetical protein
MWEYSSVEWYEEEGGESMNGGKEGWFKYSALQESLHLNIYI